MKYKIIYPSILPKGGGRKNEKTNQNHYIEFACGNFSRMCHCKDVRI